jgi:hypothetical protein
VLRRNADEMLSVRSQPFKLDTARARIEAAFASGYSSIRDLGELSRATGGADGLANEGNGPWPGNDEYKPGCERPWGTGKTTTGTYPRLSFTESIAPASAKSN